jgi:formate/nitrite transporter FocA (FNT family)
LPVEAKMTDRSGGSNLDGANSLSPASQLSGHSDAEKATIEQQSHANAALIHETIRAEGEAELNRTRTALLMSGFSAGLSMGFSLAAQGLLEARLPDAAWRPLIGSFGYTIGFLIVILGRQQLFTENTLTPILPLLHNRDRRTLYKVGRLWALVLFANIAATCAIAFVFARGPIFNPGDHRAFLELGLRLVHGSFEATMIKAVFAGWLIALMVWILPAVGSARPFILIIITYVVALGEFPHLIAGSVDAFYAVARGQATWGDYAFRFFLPTSIGNVLGGVALVAALNYGQVAPQLDNTKSR